MKIVHICPSSPYNEGWGYQENLLTKYQKKLGYDVTLIVTNTQHKDKSVQETDEMDYISPDGYRVIRKKITKKINKKISDLFAKMDVYDLLCDINPDLIFYHGIQSVTIFQVIKYKKKVNPKVIIVQDNHLDFNLGYTPNQGIKPFFICLKNSIVYKLSNKYITKVYGVTPWRKKYLEEVVHVPKDKTDVLIMGADDEKLDFKNKDKIRNDIRKKYNIKDDDFLIVTGGKIDKKKKIDILMKACSNLKNVKLIVFGEVFDDVKKDFEEYAKNKNIIYIGWVKADKVYDYYFAADLIFFPGQHSVLWEQAVASKVPCVFEKWEGMDHVDNGGNSDFVSPITAKNIENKIKELLFTKKYYNMKKIAESEATDIYLYSKIAEKSVECLK